MEKLNEILDLELLQQFSPKIRESNYYEFPIKQWRVGDRSEAEDFTVLLFNFKEPPNRDWTVELVVLDKDAKEVEHLTITPLRRETYDKKLGGRVFDLVCALPHAYNSAKDKVRRATIEETHDIEVVNGNQIMSTPFVEIPELVQDWLRIGDMTLLIGSGGVGKSTIAVYLALCLAAGVPFLGTEIKQPERVFYLDLEMGAYEFRERRLRTLLPQFPDITWSNFYTASMSYFSWLDPQHQAWLLEQLDKIQPKLWVIDNHSQFYSGELSSETDMKASVIIPTKIVMRKYLLSTLYLIHTPISDPTRPKGSNAIFNAASRAIAVQQGGSSARNRIIRRVKDRPVGRDKPPQIMTVWYEPTTFVVSQGADDESTEDILVGIDFSNGISRAGLCREFMKKLGISKSPAYERIRALIGNGELREGEDKLLYLPIEMEPVDID